MLIHVDHLGRILVPVRRAVFLIAARRLFFLKFSVRFVDPLLIECLFLKSIIPL